MLRAAQHDNLGMIWFSSLTRLAWGHIVPKLVVDFSGCKIFSRVFFVYIEYKLYTGVEFLYEMVIFTSR